MIKVYVMIAVGVAVIGGLFLFAKDQRSIGGSAERQKQVEENARFSVKARKGIVGVDTCDDAGGLYDFAKGSCKLPATQ